MSKINYTPQQIEDLINNVYGGVVTRDNLPRDLYEATLDVMTKAVEKGFGLNYADGPLGAGLLDDFRQNINVFSAAKTYQQVNDISNFIMDEKGDKLPFAQFKAAADEIFETYNTNWLRTEQDTAFNLAQSARNWTDIEANKNVLPMVLFSTVGDGRVRDEHAEFDGICLPVDDPFWDEHTPLLDWNCRCIVTSHESGEYPETTKEDLEAKDLPEIPLLFKGNPAKDGYIFDESVHPYFKVDQRYSISSQGVKTAIETPKIEKVIEPLITGGGFVPLNNIKDAKAFIINSVEENSPFKIKGVTLSSDLTLAEVNLRAETIDSLFKEYKVAESYRLDAPPAKIELRSSKTFYGVVKARLHTLDGATLVSANFGSATDLGAGRIFNELATATRSKSRVDAVNLAKATITHEFTHVIAMSDYTSIRGATQELKTFFIDLHKLRQAYNAELHEAWIASNTKGFSAVNEISLGKYASTNLNEFMAEGFTEYKLSSNPSKYATKIGELIDKNFKK
jgi:hypothetical protein